MEQAVNIKKQIPQDPTLNFSLLRKEGLAIVQELAGKIWTDYNDHDPGVTILEQLCFALTDLGYRTNFDIEDILNARRKKPVRQLRDTFYDAIDILPCTPMTTTDYRILMIDGIPEIKNIWFEPVLDHPQGIKGMYRVLVQLNEAPESDALLKDILHRMRMLFNENRNLCEDLDEITVLEADRITIVADISLAPDTIPESILAEIFFQLEQHLVPSIRTYTLNELVKEGMDMEQIFDGPLTLNGFMKPHELKPRPTEIYVSNLIEAISQIEGTQTIRDFQVLVNEIPIEGDVITIEEGKFPVLDNRIEYHIDRGTPYPIRFYRGTIQSNLDLPTAYQILYNRLQTNLGGYKMKRSKKLYKHPDVSMDNLGQYYSIQKNFPKTYGIGEFGLPHNGTETRRAHAKQLKGYLLFFEQIMANYLAQLENVDQLFAIDEHIDQTYFHRIPDDIPRIADLHQGHERFGKQLDQLTRKFDPFYDRRNRFLNHLLARFGEYFQTEVLIRQNGEQGEQDLIAAKLDFLQHYPEISQHRSRGVNYHRAVNDEEYIPPIKRRMCILFNIKNATERRLSDLLQEAEFEEFAENKEKLEQLGQEEDRSYRYAVPTEEKTEETPEEFTDDAAEAISDLPPEVEETEGTEEGSDKPLDGETEESIDPSFEVEESTEPEGQADLDYSSGFLFASEDEGLFEKILQTGTNPKNYRIQAPSEDTEKYALIFDAPNTAATKIYEADSKEACEGAIDYLVGYLESLSKQGEGFHLMEHILLRPIFPPKYKFDLLDDRDDVLLSSYEAEDMETQRIMVNDLLIAGIEHENYIILPDGEDALKVMMVNDEGERMTRLTDIFSTEEEAKAGIEKAVNYLRELKKDNQAIFARVEFASQAQYTLADFANPYTLQMSVILPIWPARFQQDDFRRLFKIVFEKNAPAHLTINYLWLDLAEMATYESIYEKWRAEKAKAEPKQPDLDQLSFELLKFIREHL